MTPAVGRTALRRRRKVVILVGANGVSAHAKVALAAGIGSRPVHGRNSRHRSRTCLRKITKARGATVHVPCGLRRAGGCHGEIWYDWNPACRSRVPSRSRQARTIGHAVASDRAEIWQGDHEQAQSNRHRSMHRRMSTRLYVDQHCAAFRHGDDAEQTRVLRRLRSRHVQGPMLRRQRCAGNWCLSSEL